MRWNVLTTAALTQEVPHLYLCDQVFALATSKICIYAWTPSKASLVLPVGLPVLHLGIGWNFSKPPLAHFQTDSHLQLPCVFLNQRDGF